MCRGVLHTPSAYLNEALQRSDVSGCIADTLIAPQRNSTTIHWLGMPEERNVPARFSVAQPADGAKNLCCDRGQDPSLRLPPEFTLSGAEGLRVTSNRGDISACVC